MQLVSLDVIFVLGFMVSRPPEIRSQLEIAFGGGGNQQVAEILLD